MNLIWAECKTREVIDPDELFVTRHGNVLVPLVQVVTPNAVYFADDGNTPLTVDLDLATERINPAYVKKHGKVDDFGKLPQVIRMADPTSV